MGASAFAFQGVNSVGSSYVQADAQRAQADYQKKIAEINNEGIDYQIQTTEDQAADAVKRGAQVAAKREQQTRLKVGEQRAAVAAEGGDPNFGSSADVIGETLAIGAADEAAIKTNAWREAYGFKAKGNQLRGEQLSNTFQARTNANALEYAARSTMITGWTEGVGYGFKAAAEFSDRSEGKKKDKSGKSKEKP